jgi:hypothetical protein
MSAFKATSLDRLLAIDDERTHIAPCTTSNERTGLSPPPHKTLNGRNNNGNNGNN